jgi:hypothetical protein
MLGEMHPVEDFCYMDNTDVGAEVCSNNNYGLHPNKTSSLIGATYTSHLTAHFPIVKLASMTPCVFNLFPSSATTKHLLDS